MTFQLLTYWESLRGDRSFPRLQDIDLEKADLLKDYSFIIDMSSKDPTHHTFEAFGGALADIFGSTYAGETLESAYGENEKLRQTTGFYDEIIGSQMPVSRSADFELDGTTILYRSLIVPLSSDGQTIDYAIGTTNFRLG